MDDMLHECERHGSDAGGMEGSLREIDAQGLQLFCRDNGENTMVIVVEAELDHDVDGSALTEAVRLAERRHTSFGCGLASTGCGLVYRRLLTPARAYEDVPGRRWRLGTDETDGRLYRVTYAGASISVSLHHGLTDGRGAFEYLKTLLYHYFDNLGYEPDAEGKVLVADAERGVEDGWPCRTHDDETIQITVPARGSMRLFGIPEDYLDEHGEYLCRHIEMAVPVASVTAVAREVGVTVTSLLVAAMARSIAETYHPTDETVVACVTCDLRPVFGATTVENFSGWTSVAEVPAMRAMGFEDEARSIAPQLAGAHDRDAALLTLRGYCEAADRMRKTPVDELFGNEAQRMVEKRRTRSGLAFMVTNVGVVDLPTDVARHVRRAAFRIPSFNATMTVAVATCGETLVMNITQPFASEGVFRALARTLTQLGIECQVRDAGLEGYDVLGPDAVADLTALA